MILARRTCQGKAVSRRKGPLAAVNLLAFFLVDAFNLWGIAKGAPCNSFLRSGCSVPAAEDAGSPHPTDGRRPGRKSLPVCGLSPRVRTPYNFRIQSSFRAPPGEQKEESLWHYWTSWRAAKCGDSVGEADPGKGGLPIRRAADRGLLCQSVPGHADPGTGF